MKAIGIAAGNATSDSVTLFCDTVGVDSKIDAYMRWDNMIAYRTHVPTAPTVDNVTINSLDVDVNVGDNLCNADAEYAISIGGGAYTLGTH